MSESPRVTAAKVEKISDIIADGNKAKNSPPGNATAEDVRRAQANALKDAQKKYSSVAEVQDIKLPSERV